jgi:hypothetical protein
MSVIIADIGNDIQFTFSSGDVYTLNKLSLKSKLANGKVYFTNADGFVQTADNKVIELTYADVSSPVYASNSELLNGVLGMAGSVALGSSGGGGGGNNTWSSASGDFTATATAGTKTITISGLSWTPGWENILSATKQAADGTVSALNTSSITVSGGVVTLANEDDFELGDTVSLTLIGPDKGYDESGDQSLAFVTNQDSEKWTSVEHLIDLAVDADTYRYVIPMEGFKDLSMHWKFTAGGTVTMTLWATNNSDADDSADTDWVDVSGDYLTKTLTGSVEQAEVVENIFFQKLMVKIVTTGSTNVVDVYIKKKAL